MYQNRTLLRALAIVAAVALIVFIFTLFTGGGDEPTGPDQEPAILSLPEYADTAATVSHTVDGTINGDEIHRAIRITVGQNKRQLDILQGYSGHVIRSVNLYNTRDAYSDFLHAINNAGFLAKSEKEDVPTDESGQCPTDLRFIYELRNNGDSLSRLWTSDCQEGSGTAAGDSFVLQDLFESQIPNYDEITQDVDLEST